MSKVSSGRRILVTGGSGFLGKYLLEGLSVHQVYVWGRQPVPGHSHLPGDLLSEVQLNRHSFDWVIHAAGLAHTIPRTATQKDLFYEINYRGTQRLLEALGQAESLPESMIYISSVSVYGQDQGLEISEDHPLRARDSYGESKVLAEKSVLQWGARNGVKIAILRLPLVVGSQPLGNLHRMIEAVKHGRWFNINGGKARRSMVNAEDVAGVIPAIALKGGIFNLCDGYHPSYFELNEVIAREFNRKPGPYVPYGVMKPLALLGDLVGPAVPINSVSLKKLTRSLTFSDRRARQQLAWKPKPVLESLPFYLKS